MRRVNDELRTTQDLLAEEQRRSAAIEEGLRTLTKEHETVVQENDDLRLKILKLERENKDFVDRLMESKMREAERMNEINTMYEEAKREMEIARMTREAAERE